MTYRMRRPRLSSAERAELWARWKQGERLSDIASALGRAPGTVCQPTFEIPHFAGVTPKGWTTWGR
jgi:hypothetical protein